MDGSTVAYRFVPSMGASGFVVPEKVATLAIVNTPTARWLFKPAITYALEPPPQAR